MSDLLCQTRWSYLRGIFVIGWPAVATSLLLNDSKEGIDVGGTWVPRCQSTRTQAIERLRRLGGRKVLPPINRSPVSARGAHETEPCRPGLCGRPRNEA